LESGVNKAILLVGHGSKYEDAGKSMARLAEDIKTHFTDCLVEICFLSMCPPGIEETVSKCVERGVNEITLMPFFVLDGFHVRKDIPNLIHKYSAKHTGVTFKYAAYLGYDELLSKLLIKRIEKAEALK
jgi:sirohydrochlorin cobaltochelatase